MKSITLFFALFALVTACKTLPPATIGGTAVSTVQLKNYAGEPYLVDATDMGVVLYASVQQGDKYSYVKYSVDIASGACTELSREQGEHKYKNYFWDNVSELRHGRLKKTGMFCWGLLWGVYKREYGIELTRKLDAENTVQYRFYGRTSSASLAGNVWLTETSKTVGVIFRRADNIQAMTPNDPLNVETWKYPLADEADYPFLSKFYYLDDKNKYFMLSFPDKNILLGNYDMLSLKQRILVKGDAGYPYIDIAVDRERKHYLWLCRRKTERGDAYFIEKRALDSIR